MASSQPLPSTRRIVTAHNNDGKAIVKYDSLIDGKQTPHGPWIELLWSSESVPPEVNTTADLGLAATGLSNDGTIVRIVDFPPKSTGLMHRSMTLDYVYVLQGEVILALDDGSNTVVKANQTVVQQATMHRWDNATDEWARMLVVLIASKKPVVNGTVLDKMFHSTSRSQKPRK